MARASSDSCDARKTRLSQPSLHRPAAKHGTPSRAKFRRLVQMYSSAKATLESMTTIILCSCDDMIAKLDMHYIQWHHACSRP
jgi:hypothetical protein